MSARAAAPLLFFALAGTTLDTQEQSRSVAHLDVAILDSAGAAVKDLTAGDLDVVTGGQSVPVTAAIRNSRPLNVLLLVDLTASSSRFDREAAEEEIDESFIQKLAAGERATLGSFASRLNLREGFTDDRRLLRSALKAVVRHPDHERFGPSPIWDHAFEAMQQLSGMDGRRALLVVSDSRATGNWRSIEDVARYAIEHRISINALDTGSEMHIWQSETTVMVRPGGGLKWLAHVTGGQYLEMIKIGRRKGTLFDAFLEYLRGIYTLSFEAPLPDGTLHTVDVKVKRPNLQVRAPNVFPAPRGGELGSPPHAR